jgi:hypothetical protein
LWGDPITNIASYTDPCRVDGGSPVMKFIVRSCQAPSGTGRGASFPWGSWQGTFIF